MTGDGVSDSPALMKAEVGSALGISGTDVSKEAAAGTLLDDDLATIVAAVEEGRVVFTNVRKYLMFLLSSNVGGILLMAAAALAAQAPTAHRRPERRRHLRHRWPARSGAGGGPSRGGPDAAHAARPSGGGVNAARRSRTRSSSTAWCRSSSRPHARRETGPLRRQSPARWRRRIRRSSTIARGVCWTEWPDSTTSSEATPSRCALS